MSHTMCKMVAPVRRGPDSPRLDAGSRCQKGMAWKLNIEETEQRCSRVMHSVRMRAHRVPHFQEWRTSRRRGACRWAGMECVDMDDTGLFLMPIARAA